MENTIILILMQEMNDEQSCHSYNLFKEYIFVIKDLLLEETMLTKYVHWIVYVNTRFPINIFLLEISYICVLIYYEIKLRFFCNTCR